MPPKSQSPPEQTASVHDAAPVPTLAAVNVSKAFGPVTVLKSITLGREVLKGPFLNEAIMREKGRKVLAQVGADVDLDARVDDLRVSEKQLVEIAKAVAQRATALILDEPTSVLTRREADRLFEIIEQFAEAGVAIIYISHRLEEVKRLARRESWPVLKEMQ